MERREVGDEVRLIHAEGRSDEILFWKDVGNGGHGWNLTAGLKATGRA